jgi:hypothetical protein
MIVRIERFVFYAQMKASGVSGNPLILIKLSKYIWSQSDIEHL